MQVIHINTNDYSGGAAIAAFRLSCALQKSGVESSLFSLYSQSGKSVTVGRFKQAISYPIRVLDKWLLPKTKPDRGLFSSAKFGYNICNYKAIQDADIIYIHWINHCFLSLYDIEKLCRTGKQIVVYMHDMWHATGGCHHSFDCTGYTKNCDKCPFFESKNNIAKNQLNHKISLFKKYPNVKIVTPSRWLADCVKQSAVFKNHSTYKIVNPIDTTIFKPSSKQSARQALSLPNNKKIICFGAQSATRNAYKGWSFLVEALGKLEFSKDDIEILIFGSDYDEQIENTLPYKTHFTGRITDTKKLLDTYNASDLFVSPSLADNFPNVIVEAMACGVPVVGFDVGGIPDLIDHQITGYLSRYKDANDLAEGINFLLTTSNYDQISKSCTEKVRTLCSYEVVAAQHIEIIKQQ